MIWDALQYVLRNPELATTLSKRPPRARQRRQMPFDLLKRMANISINAINETVSIKSYILVHVEISLVPRDTPLYFGVWNILTIWLNLYLKTYIWLIHLNPLFFHLHPNPLISILYFAILILIAYQLSFTLPS